MLHNIQGIVLKCVRYGDTSVIVRMYTDKFGVQSYLINGVRSAKSRNKQAMLQPLTLLSLVAYHRDEKNLQRVREMNFQYVFGEVPFDIVKSSIAMFMTEVLNKTLREETASESLFPFLHHAIHELDSTEIRPDFHVHFLAQLATLLGFAPSGDHLLDSYFDLEEGAFVAVEPAHYNVVQSADARAFASLFDTSIAKTLPISKSQRSRLLDSMLLFYRLHVEGFGQLRSHKILQAVLS